MRGPPGPLSTSCRAPRWGRGPAPRTSARFAPPEPGGSCPRRSGSGWMPGGSSVAWGRRRSLGLGPGSYRVERLVGDALLGAEDAHRAPGGVVGLLQDRQADTGINARILSTHPAIPAEVSSPRALRPLQMSCHRAVTDLQRHIRGHSTSSGTENPSPYAWKVPVGKPLVRHHCQVGRAGEPAASARRTASRTRRVRRDRTSR